MITSNLSRANHPSRVAVLRDSVEGRQAHILMDSVLMTDNLATIRESEIDRQLGSFNDSIMSKVEAALRHPLSL